MPLVRGILGESRALLAVKGGERTAEEIGWAEAADVGVVPLAAAGGSARSYWESLPAPPLLGGKPADPGDWADLNHSARDVAARAAHRLLRQAMYAG